MIAYGCLAILFLYVAVKAIVAYVKRKRTPTSEEVDEALLAILNTGRDSQ